MSDEDKITIEKFKDFMRLQHRVIKDLEWSGESAVGETGDFISKVCPVCDGLEKDGHAKRCRLSYAISNYEKTIEFSQMVVCPRCGKSRCSDRFSCPVCGAMIGFFVEEDTPLPLKKGMVDRFGNKVTSESYYMHIDFDPDITCFSNEDEAKEMCLGIERNIGVLTGGIWPQETCSWTTDGVVICSMHYEVDDEDKKDLLKKVTEESYRQKIESGEMKLQFCYDVANEGRDYFCSMTGVFC